MKLLLIIVLSAAALYAGAWVVASRGLNHGLQTGIAAAEARGWQIDTASLTTGGFPSRFDVHATDLTVASPDGSIVWQAPWLETAALSYRPNKVIAVLPPQQTLQVGRQTMTLKAEGLRASFSVAASRLLDFDRLTAEAQSLSLASDTGWSVAGGATVLGLRPHGPAANTYEGYLKIADLRPGLSLPSAPAAPAQVTADATVTLDRPLDRMALLPERPAITALTLDTMTVDWGGLTLSASGDLAVDPAGVPTGTITVVATGWRDRIGLLAEAGLVPAGLLQTLTSMAGMMAGADGALTLPLTLANGNMALGPVPLGPAPRIALP